MDLIALIVGLLLGYWAFGRQTVGWLFTLLHTSKFSSKKSFYDLYDVADDEVSFDFYKEHNKSIKTYADYLRAHAGAREGAYKTFRVTYDALRRTIITRNIPIAFIPAILFWSNWYFYIAGVVISVIALVGYELYKNGHRPGFYQRVIVSTILTGYLRENAKSDQR